MVVSCYHITFGTVDCAFAGLLVKVYFCPVRINRTPAAVRVKEEFTFLADVVGAASVMLDCRETYLPGKVVVGAEGEGVLDAAFTDSLALYLEGALQGLDALLVTALSFKTKIGPHLPLPGSLRIGYFFIVVFQHFIFLPKSYFFIFGSGNEVVA